MAHSTATSTQGIAYQVEGWFNSVYSDIRGYFFGSKTATSSAAPRPTGAATPLPAGEAWATHTTSFDDGERWWPWHGPAASASIVTVTHVAEPTAANTVTVTYIEPTTTSPQDYSLSSWPTPASSGPAAPAPAPTSHKSTNVNIQTLGFAALGALIVILVYLLTPVVVRLVQFIVNAAKLLFRRSGSFSKDSEMGLTSDTFSLTANIDNEDQRQGFDKKAKLRILWYMLRFGETFDEARLRFVLRQFAQNGVGPEGEPLDPKYVTFEQEPGPAPEQ